MPGGNNKTGWRNSELQVGGGEKSILDCVAVMSTGYRWGYQFWRVSFSPGNWPPGYISNSDQTLSSSLQDYAANQCLLSQMLVISAHQYRTIIRYRIPSPPGTCLNSTGCNYHKTTDTTIVFLFRDLSWNVFYSGKKSSQVLWVG